MHKKLKKIFFFTLFLLGLFLVSCKKDSIDSNPELYSFPSIENFRTIPVNPENPVTIKGVELGKKLFFDPILSKDFSLSCASCHKPELSFSDGEVNSLGVRGLRGRRNAMTLLNLAYYKGFFWDSRALTLTHQAIFPVEDTLEMDLPWTIATERLNNKEEYKILFKEVFSIDVITKEDVAKALEQFQKTLLSYNSPYDKFVRGEKDLTPAQKRGLILFNNETGDCFHCHQVEHELIIHPEKIFTNNGLDEVEGYFDFNDLGVGAITGLENNNGTFKIPTLRNLAFTAPYMHDGRFSTLEEVINFYNEGPKISPTVDDLMIAKANGRLADPNKGHWGLGLTEAQKSDLLSFLLALSDSSFINNPSFKP